MKQKKINRTISLKCWIILLAIIMIGAIIASVLLLFSLQQCGTAEIWQEGKLLYALPLSQDTSIRVDTLDGEGYNIITIHEG